MVIRIAVKVIVGLLFAVLAIMGEKALAQSTDSCSLEGGNWYKFRIAGAANNYNGTGSNLDFPSRVAAAAHAQNRYCTVNPADPHCTHGTFSLTGSNPVTLRDPLHILNTSSFSRILQTNPAVQCPADEPDPVECDMPSNPETGLANFAPSAAELEPLACDVSSHCLASKRPGTTTCGPSTCGAIYDWLDSPCDGATTPPDDTPPELSDPEIPAPSERCTTNGEAEYCVSTGNSPDGNDAQCGFLNDSWICLPATPQNGCQAVSGGGVVCDPNANAPPAPDNGTNGVEATPDGTIEAAAANGNTTNTYNYFDNDTVNNSSGGVVTGNVPAGNDQNGDGFTDGDEEEGPQGSASGGQTCDAEPTCEGDAIACAALAQAWRARCPDEFIEHDMQSETGTLAYTEGFEGIDGGAEEVELDEAFTGTGGWWGSTACPAPLNISVMGQSLNLDIWQGGCTMAANFAPFVMGIAYLLAGFLIIGRQ